VRAVALVVEKGGGAPVAAPSSGGEGGESRRPRWPAVSAEPLGQQLRVRGGAATVLGRGAGGGGSTRRGTEGAESVRWRKGAAERGHGVGGGRWRRIRGEEGWLVAFGSRVFCYFYMRWKGSELLTGHLF
jgi:hypothetical protein